MKTLTLEQMETTEGGKFWGSSTECGACVDGSQTCRDKYQVIWIRTWSSGWYVNSFCQ